MEWKDTDDDSRTENSETPSATEVSRSDFRNAAGPKLGSLPATGPMLWTPSPTKAENREASQNGSLRKRNRLGLNSDDGALEDILGQITSKLNTMSTGEDNKSDHIAAFLDVLGCCHDEAVFYLESSLWDIHTAVVLFLENNPHPTTSFPKYSAPPAPKYRERRIDILDLPEGWEARVDALTGTVYFLHPDTGTRQVTVPPGFADAHTPAFASSSSSISTESVNPLNPQAASAPIVPLVFGPESEYLCVVDDNTAFHTYTRWSQDDGALGSRNIPPPSPLDANDVHSMNGVDTRSDASDSMRVYHGRAQHPFEHTDSGTDEQDM